MKTLILLFQGAALVFHLLTGCSNASSPIVDSCLATVGKIATLSPAIDNADGSASVQVGEVPLDASLAPRNLRLATIAVNVAGGINTVLISSKPVGFSAKTCIPTFFGTSLELSDVPDGSIFVLRDIAKINWGGSTAVDVNAVVSKRITIGTPTDHPLTEATAKSIIEGGGVLLENLEFGDPALADGIFNKFEVGTRYNGHLFVFSPFGNGTSLVTSDKTINMAQLTVTGDDDLICGSQSLPAINLHNEWGPGNIPVFGPLPRASLQPSNNWLTFNEHYGTHIDAGRHFSDAGQFSPDRLPICHSIAPCVKVSAPIPASIASSNYSVPLSVFLDWETRNGRRLPEGGMVMVDTGFGANWNNEDAYNQGYPGVDPEAAEFLASERKIRVLGIDSATLDRQLDGVKFAFPSHVAIAKHDVIGLVNLKSSGLDQLSESTPATCLVIYFRIANDGTGSPSAVVAFPAAQQSSSTPAHHAETDRVGVPEHHDAAPVPSQTSSSNGLDIMLAVIFVALYAIIMIVVGLVIKKMGQTKGHSQLQQEDRA